MATTVTINGTNYSIPAAGESGWGSNVSNYLIAISDNGLFTGGGTRTLTADLNLGANYGLVAKYYKSIGANISSTGIVRLANAETIAWRNQANAGDLGLTVNSSDRLQFDSVNILTASSTDTLTNKTFDVDGTGNSLSNIANANIKAGAAIAQSKLALDITNTEINASAAIALSKLAATTASRALVSDGSGFVSAASVTATELGYVSGVTSAIQTQLDAKQAASNAATTDGTNTFTGVNTFDEEIILKEQATPSNPSSTYYKIYPKSDGKLYKLNSAGEEVEIGSGAGSGGGVNYVTNGDFNVNTSGWSNSGGGTLSHDTTTEIEGSGSLKFVSNGSADTITGTIDTIPSIDVGVLLGVEMVIDVTDASGSYATGDFTVEIHDGTAAVGEVVSLKAGRNRITTNELGFVAESGTTYTIKINDVSANASPSADYFILDRVKVTSDRSPAGAVITDWESYTPDDTQGLGSATSDLQWCRVGSNLLLMGDITTGTVTTAEPRISLPNNLNASFLNAVTTTLVGRLVRSTASGVEIFNILANNGSPYLRFSRMDSAGDDGTVPVTNATTAFGNSQRCTLQASVPIAEWAGAGTVNLMDRGITTSNARAHYRQTSGLMGGTDQPMPYNSGVYAEGISYNSSTGVLTVDASGRYRILATHSYNSTNAITMQVKTGSLGGTLILSTSEAPGVAYGTVRLDGTLNLTANTNYYLAYTLSGASIGTNSSPYLNLFIERIPDHSALAPVGFGTTDEADSNAKYLLPRYQESGEGDTGAVTFDNTAPSGTVTSKYKWVRVGNQVTFYWRYEASVAGVNNNRASINLPSDMPVPALFTTAGSSEFTGFIGSGGLATASNNSTVGVCQIYYDGANYILYVYPQATNIATKYVNASITYIPND